MPHEQLLSIIEIGAIFIGFGYFSGRLSQRLDRIETILENMIENKVINIDEFKKAKGIKK